VAEISLPRGLIVTAAGAVIFADSNNQRLRRVDAGGTITTIAGSGVQGSASDGLGAATVAMNSPRGVAVSSFGAPVYADALSHLVRESVGNGSVYVPAGLAPSRTTAVTLSASSSNGQTSAVATVVGLAGTAQGVVELLDSGTVLTHAALSAGTATFGAQTLPAGAHNLSAVYLGDGVNPAGTSSAVTVGSGVEVITVTANPASAEYGQAIPVLSGSVSVAPLQGDSIVYTTSAVPLSPVGSYPILATLSGPGSAGYTVVMSPQSGALQIVQAGSVTAEAQLTQGSYAGLPLLLSASVNSTTQGVPTGTVTFLDSGVVVTAAPLVNGIATGTYLAPGAGGHSVVAKYAGDRNFLASSSAAVTATVAEMPDFSIAASAAKQTVAAGEVANFAMTVGGQSGTFTGVVDLSASGLPAGATVSFSPPQVVPGASLVHVTMSVQTSASLLVRKYGAIGGVVLACMLSPLWGMGMGKRKGRRWVTAIGLLVAMICVSGCGARSISTAVAGGKTYTLIVTGTSTNLAGALVSHSTQVTLVVE